MKKYRLSKSKIISGLICKKRLYLEIHHPELKEISTTTENIFKMGHLVGEAARNQFPKGYLIEHEDNLAEALRETVQVLEKWRRKPIFEATFNYKDVLVRSDVLIGGKHGYRLIEVKSSTSVKEYHLWDCAVQKWVLEGAGYPVARVELAHIDKTFVYPGKGNYKGLLRYVDITREVDELIPEVPKWTASFKRMLAGNVPRVKVGKHCKEPFSSECLYKKHCQPENTKYPVNILPHGRKIIEELKSEGIEDVRDIPKGRLSSANHERVRRITKSGKPELDPELGKRLRGLAYPRYYIDFETANPAIPFWAGTRPYQGHLPFQWSCHIESKNGQIRHKEFLDLSGKKPFRRLTKSLIVSLRSRGPVIMYSNYEEVVLKKLAVFFPDLKSDLERIIERLVDLWPLTKAHYYHPAMKGKWSIKAVLPTVAPELNYSDLEEVQGGGGAQAAYYEAIELPDSSSRKASLKENLLEYCKLDTLAMVKLVNFFENVKN